MKVYLAENWFGTIALSEKGERLETSITPKEAVDKLVDNMLNIEDEKPTLNTLDIVQKLKKKYPDVEFVVESYEVAKEVGNLGVKVVVEPGTQVLREFRAKLPEVAIELGFVKDFDEYSRLLHEVQIEAVRRRLRKVAQKRDLLVIQSVRAIDDIDRTLNLFAARLREWYSIHFPELDDLVRDHIAYAEVVAGLGYRENITEEALRKLGFSEGKARRIATMAKKSMGADLSDFDIKPMQTLARIMLELHRLRSELVEYTGTVMREVAPNITKLVGPVLGARLLSLAGSLENLAKLPASTIQVLGAEKALFRALRTGGKPPKHGVIFQFPDIHRSPRWQRGKIARALATKLAIAARVDYFTGRDIGDQLKKALTERIKEIKELYPRPPRREERRERRRRRPRRGKK